MSATRRRTVPILLGALTLISFGALAGALYSHCWDVAITYATLSVGFVAADVVVWQGYLIKRQLAFSTYLDLDKEWNSDGMITARQAVHAPGSQEWDHSRLEAILEFFEKVAALFKVSGDMPLVYESTLGWYAARYFLFAREGGQISYLEGLWQDHLYRDLAGLYASYLINEVGRSKAAQEAWEKRVRSTEEKFWVQERRG